MIKIIFKMKSELITKFYFSSLLIMLLVPLYSQEESNNFICDQSITLTIDQDAFSRWNEDRNYTMGFSLNYSGRMAGKNYLGFPWLRKQVDWLFGLKGMHASGSEFLPGLAFMVSAFTPENLTSTVPVVDDRPYSSIVAISSFRSTLFKGYEDEISQSALTTRLNVGLLGTSLASSVQTYIHEQMWFGSTRPIPLGWDNQISNGGEPTLLYQIQYSEPLLNGHIRKDGAYTRRKWFEVIWNAEGNAGYYTNAAVGTVLRLGWYETPFWYMNSAGMSSINQAPALVSDHFEIFVSVGARVRGIVYNGLLQGQFTSSAHALDRSEVRTFIWESEVGVITRYKNLSCAFFPFQYRSAEHLLNEQRSHKWGTFMVVVSW